MLSHLLQVLSWSSFISNFFRNPAYYYQPVVAASNLLSSIFLNPRKYQTFARRRVVNSPKYFLLYEWSASLRGILQLFYLVVIFLIRPKFPISLSTENISRSISDKFFIKSKSSSSDYVSCRMIFWLSIMCYRHSHPVVLS